MKIRRLSTLAPMRLTEYVMARGSIMSGDWRFRDKIVAKLAYMRSLAAEADARITQNNAFTAA